jgi:hypothetical protein
MCNLALLERTQPALVQDERRARRPSTWFAYHELLRMLQPNASVMNCSTPVTP